MNMGKAITSVLPYITLAKVTLNIRYIKYITTISCVYSTSWNKIFRIQFSFITKWENFHWKMRQLSNISIANYKLGQVFVIESGGNSYHKKG